jgi:hypothetical protein
MRSLCAGREVAAELLRANVDLIFAAGDEAIDATKQVSRLRSRANERDTV